MTIIVTPLSYVHAMVMARRPSHLVTLLDPDHLLDTPQGMEPGRHLRIGVNDICDPAVGLLRPDAGHVEQLIAFGRTWDGAAPLLVHCFAGISRSTASAFVLACERNPDVPELTIARRLREVASHASPNRRIVSLADDMLERGGRMVDAVDAIGYGDFSSMGVPFDLPIRY